MSDKELAKRNATALAQQDFGDFAGVGMENITQDDISIPFLGLIQKLSPQVEGGNAKFIEGAQVGQLFNTVTNELIGDGNAVYFVACCKESKYVEWVPRDAGGGLVGMHEPGSEFVAAAKQAAIDQFKLKTDEGHDLVETNYVYGMLIDGAEGKTIETPIVIGFSSSKIKVYKAQLMTRIRTIKGDPPMFAFRFKITSVPAKNKAGQPYHNLKIEPACGDMASSANLPGTDFEGLLVEGKALVEAVHGGRAKADHQSAGTNQQPRTGSDADDEPF